MMSKYIEPWSRRRFASAKSLDFLTFAIKANEPCPGGCKPQLGLTGMIHKIFSCSWPMPKNYKKPSEIRSVQPNADKVEALANVLEQTLISQQLNFMHTMAQHGQTSNSIAQFRSDPRAPKESWPGNGLKGPDDKEEMTRARNLPRDDAFFQELS